MDPEKVPVNSTTESTNTAPVDNNEPKHVSEESIKPEIETKSSSECESMKFDIDALKRRNKELFENFIVYREEAERNASSKDSEITRLQTSLESQQKDIETLTETVHKLTNEITEKDSQQTNLNNAISLLKDDLEVEKTKNAQISSQYMTLQLKLAQEKATKTIKSTASSISSSIKSISQELFTKKASPINVNGGYSDFLFKYNQDMKHIEETVKSLEDSYTKLMNEWKQREEEHTNRVNELLNENKALHEEKNALENSLRSTIQTLETSNNEMKSEMIKARIQYKVSDQEENNKKIENLENHIKKIEEEKTTAITTLEKQNNELQNQVQEQQELYSQQCQLTKNLERQIMALEDVDPIQQEEEKKKEIFDSIQQWKEDERRYDAPGFDLMDASVMSLFSIWTIDNNIRQQVLQWMAQYMRLTEDTERSEIVLQNMPIEVYEGFAQVVVPILQSRVNSTIKIQQRQTVLYEMKIIAGEHEMKVEEDVPAVIEEALPVEPTEAQETAEQKQKKSSHLVYKLYIEKRWLWND